MTTPLITDIARARRAERIDVAAEDRMSRRAGCRPTRVGFVRQALADALRRLATHVDSEPASSLATR